MQYAFDMIRAFELADEDDLIRVWLASTIPGQSFLPRNIGGPWNPRSVNSLCLLPRPGW